MILQKLYHMTSKEQFDFYHINTQQNLRILNKYIILHFLLLYYYQILNTYSLIELKITNIKTYFRSYGRQYLIIKNIKCTKYAFKIRIKVYHFKYITIFEMLIFEKH